MIRNFDTAAISSVKKKSQKNLSQCKIDLVSQKLILQFFIARIDGSSLGDPHMTVLKPEKEIFLLQKKFSWFFILFTLIISSRKLPKKEKHDFFHTYCTILLLFCHFWVNLLPSAWLLFSQTNVCISQIIDKNFFV